MGEGLGVWASDAIELNPALTAAFNHTLIAYNATDASSALNN
jgi:hypothetical protein